MKRFLPCLLIFVIGVTGLAGCSGDSDDGTETTGSDSASTGGDSTDSATEDSQTGETRPVRKSFQPVSVGGGNSTPSSSPSGTGRSGEQSGRQIDNVIDALKPLQVVLGSWRGSRQNAGGVETHDWVWDLRTDRNQPALVLTTKDGEFFEQARLTYDPAGAKYLMTTTDADNLVRQFEGGFDAEPKDEPGDDGKSLQRTFKLKLTEHESADGKQRFEYVFSQQNNSRYQLYVARARGSAALRVRDVVGAQREGTSFARSDEDYGDRTCIISQGLGTMSVSYQGKTYYVCCTGCKAAFEDDPERWIARLQEQKKNSNKD